MPLPIPVDLDFGTPSGGFLTQVRTPPEGWQRGISFIDPTCLAPTVMGECPTTNDLKPTQRPDMATFRPVSLIAAVECTTLGATDVGSIADRALTATRDHALARELLTGAASERDSSDPIHANPSLAGTAIDLGAEFGSLAEALGCLETNLAETSSGRGGYLLVGPALLTHLKDDSLIVREGSRWQTATGLQVVASSGFDGRSPGSSDAPAAGDPLYMYAVTSLWAAVGSRASFSDVNRAVNTVSDRAEDLALTAFTPCGVYAAAASTVTACVLVPPTPEPEPVPPPAITTVVPDEGTTEGGTAITVTGSGFMEGA